MKEVARIKISRTRFWIITISILLLPVSMKWRVLAFGKLMEGEAQYTITTYVTRGSYKYTQILFLTENNDEYMIYSPQNVTYPKGTKIKLLFLEKAQKYLILTFSGIFYKMENVIVYIIFLIWMAFYFSFVKKKY